MDITSLYGGIRPLIDGVTVSNDTRVTLLNNNDMIIGPTGAGKTGGYVIPNLMTCRGSAPSAPRSARAATRSIRWTSSTPRIPMPTTPSTTSTETSAPAVCASRTS